VQIVLLGVILGVLAWKSNSIFPSATVHAINNGIALVAANTSAGEFTFMTWKGHVNPLLLVAAIVVLYVSMVLFYRYSEEDMEIPTFLNQPL
jgi:membrane protease YdiL (CAAX protease family)